MQAQPSTAQYHTVQNNTYGVQHSAVRRSHVQDSVVAVHLLRVHALVAGLRTGQERLVGLVVRAVDHVADLLHERGIPCVFSVAEDHADAIVLPLVATRSGEQAHALLVPLGGLFLQLGFVPRDGGLDGADLVLQIGLCAVLGGP